MADAVSEGIQLATALVDIARDLLAGTETPQGARIRVRDILPEQSESEKAEDDILAARQLAESIAELDDVGEDEPTNPGAR